MIMFIGEDEEIEIHKRQICIAKNVLDLCEKHNLYCFLVGGSLLGAVKEQNILLGDKDIDIGMLREDYERFLELENEFPSNLKLLNAGNTKNYNWLFAKVYQKGTSLIKKNQSIYDFEVGIYVDVCPYDYVPENINARKRCFKRCKVDKWLMLVKGEKNVKSFKVFILQLLSKFFTRDMLIHKYAKGLEETRIVQNITGGNFNDWFYIDEIRQRRRGFLADVSFNIPAWERYLGCNYPNWENTKIVRNELEQYEVNFE